MVLLLTSLLAPMVAASGGTFVDDDDSIFEGDIEWLAAAGITKGCNPPANTMFCPNDFVTRGQMAAFMTRALGLTDRLANPFGDDDGSVFEADIERLAAAGITKGCNPPANTMFCPNDFVTRGQMAAFMHRALDDVITVTTTTTTTTTAPSSGGTPPPEKGSATIMACGTDVERVTFWLDEACVEVKVIDSSLTQAIDWGSIEVRQYWIDPGGFGVHPCEVSRNCTVTEYHYSDSGSWLGWSDYLYVDGEGRDPGWYSYELWAGNNLEPRRELIIRRNLELRSAGP